MLSTNIAERERYGELRRALISAIARRVGKPIAPVSLEEAYSDIPLAEIYARKRRNLPFGRAAAVIERLWSRLWH
jgi:hypothetical protein